MTEVKAMRLNDHWARDTSRSWSGMNSTFELEEVGDDERDDVHGDAYRGPGEDWSA